jgi:uncharacterized protein (TIGR02594 family)
MSLPVKYQWLETIGVLPKLLSAGLQYLGVKEIPGSASNPVIMQMAKELKIDNIYKNDDIAWCAVFISYLCQITGKPLPGNGADLLRAASFAKWGYEVVRGDEQLGDILVFTRPGGNHVGICIAESKDSFHILGGNQSNAVTITEISKYRLSAARRFYKTAPPESVRRYVIDSSGKLSTNEA